MDYLTDNKCTINQIICSDDIEFKSTIDFIKNGAENHHISLMFIKMRDIVKNNRNGSNIIRYLTSKMVNLIIREQIGTEPHWYLSNLYIHKKSGMFDAMPFAMSLHNHNPNFYDLVNAIEINDRDDELLYSYIRNNIESNDELYTPIDEIGYFDDIPILVEKYNSKLLKRLPNSDSFLVLENGFLYINEYEKNSIKIIKKLDEYVNKVALIRSLAKRKPALAGKRLSIDSAYRSWSSESIGICACRHHGERDVNVLRQSLQRALEGILIVRPCELVEADIQVAPAVSDNSLRVGSRLAAAPAVHD